MVCVWTALACGLACALGAVAATCPNQQCQRMLAVTAVASVLAYGLTVVVIPVFGAQLQAKGLFGRDLNKPSKLAKDVPESLGVVSGTVFLVCVIFYQVTGSFQMPEAHSLSDFNAALTSICFMLLLGFVDDVVDLRWRYKLVLPTIASLPLVVEYTGPTSILVPPVVREWFSLPTVVELGIVFQLYMSLLSVFCTNSINIYAGINGLEAGQSLVIALAVMIFNVLELSEGTQHIFSLSLMAPFAATTLGMLRYNWYPSRVFVGDCYTYFAGVIFAVVGILSHFPKTLLLFFIPQVLNFVVSLPQLFKIIPCPRHRLPKLNQATGKLEPTPNLNLVNLALRVTGPLHEETLCSVLLAFQVVCCAVGMAARFWLERRFG